MRTEDNNKQPTEAKANVSSTLMGCILQAYGEDKNQAKNAQLDEECEACKVPAPGTWDDVWQKEQKIMGEAHRKYEAGESKYPYIETEFPPKECNYPGQRPTSGDCSGILWGGAEPHFMQKIEPSLKPEQIYERIKKNLEIVRNATEEIEFLEELMKNYQAKINQKKKEPDDK